MKRFLLLAAAMGAAALAACETNSTGSQDSFQTECRLDEGGKCRYTDGRFAPASCCPGQQEIVVPTNVNLTTLLELVDDGVVDWSYWEDEGVSCSAEEVRDHEISSVLTDEFDHFIGLELTVTADLPMPYCAGYGATSAGTCWVRLEQQGGALEVAYVECEEGAYE